MSWGKPIEDYYGTSVYAEPVMASPGPMVDVEWQPKTGPDGKAIDWLRLTPEDALKLAEQLTEAAYYPAEPPK